MADPAPSPPRRAFGPGGGPITERLLRALSLRPAFYRQAADDVTGTGPAGAFVCLIALVRAAPALYDLAQIERLWAVALLLVAAAAMLRWALIGAAAQPLTRLAGRPADYRRLLRTLGYAEAPTVFLAVTPALAPAWYLPAHVVLLAWPFAATAVALHAATGAPPARAVALAVPVFLVQQLTLALAMLGGAA